MDKLELIFKNEPGLDFSNPDVKQKMESAFANLKKGEKYPLLINGEKKITDESIVSINPGKKSEVIGYASVAEVSDADAAIQAAKEAFATWRLSSVETRVELAQKVIELLQRERYNMNAIMIEESGKNWGEADGEICETIDFINAYCIGAQHLDKGIPLLNAEGEQTSAFYIPIGIGVIIPPWNFPLALMAGMIMGALTTGNTVVVKPASDTPVVAWKFIEILEEAGYPAGVVNFLTGSGGTMGSYLVEHPETRFINFTGSKEVGLGINTAAANTSVKWIKRIVAEMGGKNAIIVDSSANLDEAAKGVASAAFFFQGQKCSACSRALVHEDVYDEFVEKLVAFTKTIEMGLGKDDMPMGPVISQRAFDGITNYIEIGRSEGTVVYGGKYDDTEGFYIEPTIIKDIVHGDRISVEEIFGPVVAVIKTKSFEEAMTIANDTEYGLTGSVYTSNEEQIKIARDDFHVGNLYFNRRSTGAVVMQHPFGGYNMSGTAAKSGTTDYLYNFVQMKSVTRVDL